MSEYLTSAFAGTGGSLKEGPEDFRVEEIPAYHPSGTGEHLYLEIEKSGLTTLELIARLARACGLREGDIGYAGLKDARATTRQFVSLPAGAEKTLARIDIPGVSILSVSRHSNKLRLGHLAGNRFRIRIRNVDQAALENARDSLHVLETLGVPNFFGQQRYGVLGNSQRIGSCLLRGDLAAACGEIIGDPQQIANARWQEAAQRYQAGDPAGAAAVLPGRFRDEQRLLQVLARGGDHRRAVLSLPRTRLRLYLSACQAQLFDRLVRMRLAQLERLWLGDLAFKHANGACFSVLDPAAEQPRADALEISPTAPLYGYKVRLATGQAGILEQSLLDKEKLTLADFRLGDGLSMEGERRPIRVPLQTVRVDADGGDLLLGFTLPKGSYATSVLREVMKPATEG